MLAKVTRVQTGDRTVNQLQDNIAASLIPFLINPLLNGSFLNDVVLTSGANVLNHKLGRNLVGWIITRRNGVATVYDTQATNSLPNKTLLLTASAGLTCSIYVF